MDVNPSLYGCVVVGGGGNNSTAPPDRHRHASFAQVAKQPLPKPGPQVCEGDFVRAQGCAEACVTSTDTQ